MIPLYLLIFLLFIIIAVTLYGFIKFKIHSLAYFFSLAMILQVLIPAFYLLFVNDFRFPLDLDVVMTMLSSYGIYMLLAIPFLILILLFILKYPGNKIQSDNTDLAIHPNFIYVLYGLSFLQLLFLFIDGDIAFLFETIQSGNLMNDDYKLLRVQIIEEGFKNYQTSSILNYFRFVLSSGTIFGYFLVLYVSKVREKFYSKHILLFCLVIMNMFIISFKGFEKGPILLFLGLSFLIYFREKVLKISALKIISFFLLGNFFVTQLVSFTTGLSLVDSFLFLYFRIFIEPTVSAYMHFSVFPSQVNFVNFSNMGLVRNLFNQTESLKTGSIAIETAQEFTGLYYSANANIVPTGWAQMGKAGVVLYTFITFISFLLVDIHTHLMGSKNSKIILSFFYGYFMLYYANTSFENFIFTSCFFLWPLVLPYVLVVTKNELIS